MHLKDEERLKKDSKTKEKRKQRQREKEKHHQQNPTIME